MADTFIPMSTWTPKDGQTYEIVDAEARERITAIEQGGGGSGTVTSVNNVQPDANGNVSLSANDVGAGTYTKPSGGIPASDLDQAVQDKLDSISTSGSGLTGAQIAAISALFQLAVYAEDPSDAFDAFLAAFPIYQDGSVLTIICGVTASLSDTTLTLS